MDVTLFEIHLDGAQFGPATIGDATRDSTMEGEESTAAGTAEHAPVDGGSRSFARRVLPLVPFVVAVGVAAGYAVSRRFGGDGAPEAGAEPVEIEA